MAKASTLKDYYLLELNDMHNGCAKLLEASKASRDAVADNELVEAIDANIEGQHRTLKTLTDIIESHGATVDDDPNKALSALGEELKATIEAAPSNGPLRDAVIAAKWRQVLAYPVPGFEGFARHAEALELRDEAKALRGLASGMREQFGTIEKIDERLLAAA